TSASPGMTIEGRLGPLVTLTARPDQAVAALAALPEVAVVRLPRVAHPELQPAPEKPDDVTPMVASGLVRLHQMAHKGKGIRLAVVDSDFRGWEALAKERPGFPTVLVDLTRERNRDLEPDRFPEPADQVGHGTRCAQAVLKAAPEVDLTLIRVDP